jgi:thiamine biosynthesis lipoprotein
MGVEAGITLYAPDREHARSAARAAFGRMIELDAVMSDYRTTSELSRLCASTPGETHAVSTDLFAVLERSLEIAAATDGAFDPTIGPLSHLWRAARREGRVPAPEAIERAMARTGWRRLQLDPDARTAVLMTGDMQLDLGGIGKGFAADAALATLRAHGLPRALVDLGGDLAAGDPPPDRAAWIVLVDPGGGTPKRRRIALANTAVATSSDVEQSLAIDGDRYSHIVDPRTGLGLRSRVAVTVIAPDAATADALASALSVLGPDRGRVVLERFPGVEAIVETTTDGQFLSSER